MWSPCRACVAVLLCAFLASAQDVPRVALLFLTHGRQQLENVWLTFLQGVADVQVPGLSEQDWAHLQEAERIERLRALLLTKGELRANSIIQDAPCFNNSMVREATAQLKNTWRQRFTVERPRGARLADPDRAPHPVYAAQSLFSIYVHVRPDFPGYTETSVFHGREITPATWSERYRHSLGVASLLLMEAALYDTTVRNVHFAVVSESTVPLYNGGMLWLQLINEKRSRVGETHTFKELLQQDQEVNALSPYMFMSHFYTDSFQKTTQWVGLTRSAAFVAVHDTIVEPWFATFGGSHWRCAFRDEGMLVLEGVQQLLREGVEILHSNSAATLQLRRRRFVPRTFSAGELLEGLLPDDEEYSAIQHRFEQRTRSHGTFGDFFGGARKPPPRRAKPQDSATPEQRMALDEYRRALRIRAHPWSWLPFDEAIESLSVRTVNGSTDSPEAREQSEISAQIWSDLLSDRTERAPGRDLRGAAGRRVLAEPLRLGGTAARSQQRGGAVPGVSPSFFADSEQARRLGGPEALQEKLLRARGRFVDSGGGAQVTSGAGSDGVHVISGSEAKRDDDGGEAGTATEALKEDTTLTFSKNDLLTNIAEHDSAGELEGPREHSANESLWSILTEERKPLDERPYNLDWPFEHCEACGEDTAVAPWRRWSMAQQAGYLTRFFPLPGSRLSNIVSDECMIKSMLQLYGARALEWQTDGPSSHVDWSRADNHGHPGAYSAAALKFHPDGVRQRIRGDECDKWADSTYRSAQAILTRPNAAHVSWIPAEFGTFWHLWQFSPMPDTCPMFARKFEHGVEAVPSFFSDCHMLGYRAECLRHAHHTSLYPGLRRREEPLMPGGALLV